jgi:hypothetical protein
MRMEGGKRGIELVFSQPIVRRRIDRPVDDNTDSSKRLLFLCHWVFGTYLETNDSGQEDRDGQVGTRQSSDRVLD